ncbi:fungal-specific transcription factor domain-containing protein [Calycina marina]|uniref:Fungal-specific transcription factor domain-containing protein n=1 Tax=Calycina marina TaxID=1763456 RepID=A0A9P8CGI3_9HELO|nr:fungal-specific transcription factor domain-containing protein [Calycina marina]
MALPNIDLNDPNIDQLIQQREAATASRAINPSIEPRSADRYNSPEDEAPLKSMIQSTGQLELDDAGNWDFRGGSSGLVFMGRMRESLGSLLGGRSGTAFLPWLPKTPLGPYDSPKSATGSPMDSGLYLTPDLPPREIALVLCNNSLECGCSLMRFVHQPTFYEMVNRIYTTRQGDCTDEEYKFLPLLYVVLALGCMFHAETDENLPAASNYRSGIDQGLRYFRSARTLMDITDCRDIVSLQAVLFMILFLQSSSNLSTCYSYIGVALRSALRMGLHRNLSGKFNPIERETRRRVFWVVRKMDIYVSALLGFPHMMSSDDIDQELPMEVDDQYITKDAILPMPSGMTSIYAASNAHTALMDILTKVVKYIYPTKGSIESCESGASPLPYMISIHKIREIEKDLNVWLDKLPADLRPGGDETPESLRVQQLLRLAYAHVQMMLYRPFLHYVVPGRGSKGKKTNDRSYACAAAGVSVSRNIVHITSEMKRRGLLIGAFWFTMYTTFFAIISLVFFVLENPDEPGSKEILADAIAGKEALKGLAKRSQAADRCTDALRTLFEHLPSRLVKTPSTKSRKRGAPSPTAQSIQSAHNVPRPQGTPEIGIARARTLPAPAAIRNACSARGSLDDKRMRSNSNSASNPNLYQSFQDPRLPNTPSSMGTPSSESARSSYHVAPHQQSHQQNNPIPDLSAMMFPSADPFAYPTQPNMNPDGAKGEDFGTPDAGCQGGAPMFLSNESGMNSTPYDDLEGQLFLPIPPYMMHGQQNFGMGGQIQVPAMESQQDMNYCSGVTPRADMYFDNIFPGEDWNNSMLDPVFTNNDK